MKRIDQRHHGPAAFLRRFVGWSIAPSVRIRSVAVLLLWGSFSIAAEPYRPKSDDEVLETLPRSFLASRNELAALRRELAADSQNPELAAQVADRFLKLGSLENDPRFYGYARAAIQPWWEAADASPEILRIRAKLKENDHRHAAARSDLQILLRRQPRNVQAWIEYANICRVQGDYDAATQACQTLSTFASQVPIVMCRAPVQAVTGSAADAYASLKEIVPTVQAKFPGTLPWVRTMQAQIAQSLGQTAQAEQHFRDGLRDSAGNNSYLNRMYADFLLDHGRDTEALELVRDHTNDNGTLLRAAIAARRTGNGELAATWQAQLESRFEELRLRESQPHGRFEARYALYLAGDSQRALEIAAANWERQKELLDSRIVLEAALAANRPDAARPVIEFLTQHGTQDVKLQELMQRLESMR